MDQADRDENVAIGRFQRMERLWRDVAEAATRADAVLRLERALDRLPQPTPPMRVRRA